MKYIQPVLFVDPYWEKDVLIFARDNNIYNFDVLCNYSYQKKNIELLMKYVDVSLAKNMPFGNDIYETVDLIEKSKQKLVDPLKYFLIHYMKRFDGYEKAYFEDYISKLKDEWKPYIKNGKFKVLRNHELNRSYNTIIFGYQPKDAYTHLYNRIYNFIPNYYNKIKTWQEALKHLMEGGYADFNYITDIDYDSMVYVMGEGYEQISEFIYKKLEEVKVPLPQIRFGL